MTLCSLCLSHAFDRMVRLGSQSTGQVSSDIDVSQTASCDRMCSGIAVHMHELLCTQASVSVLLTCPEGRVLGNTIGQAANGGSNMSTMTKAIIRVRRVANG